ncbi:hypothetical protein TrST_g116 [Triparma strigata]|uniref:TLDc domain-containing protein n=1 Tax=Triparma strigata TaxID=1606541 RepID=A0A9W7E1I1_9STRA|nr:hypothetical protein TrST_g116 [Triparma strigata]
MFAFLNDEIDSSIANPETSAAWTRLLLEERYSISNGALESLRKLPTLDSDPSPHGPSAANSAKKKEDGVMNLCCDSLYARILPFKCPECSKPSSSKGAQDDTASSQLSVRSTAKLSSLAPTSPNLPRAFVSMLVSLEGLLLHGLSWSSTPTYGSHQVEKTCHDFLSLLTVLQEGEGKFESNADKALLESVRRKRRRNDGGLCGGVSVKDREQYDEYLRLLNDVAKKVKVEGVSTVEVVRSWVKEATGVWGSFEAFYRILFHSSNREYLEMFYAPWSLFRSPAEDLALKNALITLSRMKLHCCELDSSEIGVRVPSQWWPLNHVSYKARGKFDEEHNPANSLNEKDQNVRKLKDDLNQVKERLAREVGETKTVEDGLDKFADVLDRGLHMLVNVNNNSKAKAGEGSATNNGGGSATSAAQYQHQQLKGPGKAAPIPGSERGSNQVTLFNAPLSVLARSQTHSGPKCTYDPEVCVPLKVLKLLDRVERDIDHPNLFEPQGLDMQSVMEKFDDEDETLNGREASVLLVKWLGGLKGGGILGPKGDLLAALKSSDGDRIRAYVRSVLTPPADLVIVRPFEALKFGLERVHSVRNDLKGVRVAFLMNDCLFGLQEGTQTRAARSPSSEDDAYMQEGVLVSDFVLDYFIKDDTLLSEIKRDHEARLEQFNKRFNNYKELVDDLGRELDVSIQDSSTVQGGSSEKGPVDLELLLKFSGLVVENYSKVGENIEREDSSTLGVLRHHNFTNEDGLRSVGPTTITVLSKFLVSFSSQALSLFGRLNVGSPTVFQVAKEVVDIVKVNLGMRNSVGNTDRVNFDDTFDISRTAAPERYDILAEEDGFIDVAVIGLIMFSESFDQGMGNVRSSLGMSLKNGKGLKSVWEGYVLWKGHMLVEQREEEEKKGKGSSAGTLERREEFNIDDEDIKADSSSISSSSSSNNNNQVTKDFSSGSPRAYVKNSRIITKAKLKNLSEKLPHYIQRRQIVKLFDSNEGGTLDDLYEGCSGYDYSIILIEDEEGNMFGGFAVEEWKKKEGWGGGEDSFVFKFQGDEVKSFSNSKGNKMYQTSTEEFLGMGSGKGGTFAIYIDRELAVGGSCETGTFNNVMLSGGEEFIVEKLEVWSFVI